VSLVVEDPTAQQSLHQIWDKKLSENEFGALTAEARNRQISSLLFLLKTHRKELTNIRQALLNKRADLLKGSNAWETLSITMVGITAALTFSQVMLTLLEVKDWTGVYWLIGSALAALLSAAAHIRRLSKQYPRKVESITVLIAHSDETVDDFDLHLTSTWATDSLPEDESPHYFLYARLFSLAEDLIPMKQRIVQESLMLSNRETHPAS